MDYTTKIKNLIRTVEKSETFHAVLIEGPAGYGKSTAVSEAFTELNIEPVHLGNYSTPLNLFLFLQDNHSKWILIDDSAGIFDNPLSMSLLKGATWPIHGGNRQLKWGSTGAKLDVNQFVFSGKLVIICNSFPFTADAKAILSRSIAHKIILSLDEAKASIIEAAKNQKYFSNTNLASEVADYLIRYLNEKTIHAISFRTLRLGYELAIHNPDLWRQLLLDSISHSNLSLKSSDSTYSINTHKSTPKIDPEDNIINELLSRLSKSNLSIKDQEKEFELQTGLKRRRFYQYRRNFSLSKIYQKK
jgi:hypothetical protein